MADDSAHGKLSAAAAGGGVTSKTSPTTSFAGDMPKLFNVPVDSENK